MSKQDRTSSRTPSDTERKYILALGKSFAECMGIATDARAKAENVGGELTKEVARIDQTIKAHEASIGLIVDNGEVQGSIIIEAINNESSAKISADRLDIEGKTLNIKVDATNIDGKLTAEKIDADGIVAEDVDITGKVTAKSGTIGGWKVLNSPKKISSGSVSLIADDSMQYKSLVDSTKTSPARLVLGEGGNKKTFTTTYQSTLRSVSTSIEIDTGFNNASNVSVVVSEIQDPGVEVSASCVDATGGILEIEVVVGNPNEYQWQGGGYQLTITFDAFTPSIIALDDGSFYAENTKISGEIEAKNGSIGGWEIGDNLTATTETQGLGFTQRQTVTFSTKGVEVNAEWRQDPGYKLDVKLPGSVQIGETYNKFVSWAELLKVWE